MLAVTVKKVIEIDRWSQRISFTGYSKSCIVGIQFPVLKNIYLCISVIFREIFLDSILYCIDKFFKIHMLYPPMLFSLSFYLICLSCSQEMTGKKEPSRPLFSSKDLLQNIDLFLPSKGL